MRSGSLLALTLVLTFLLAVPCFAAGAPGSLVVSNVVKDGAAYDVTLRWGAVAGADSYKTQLGGIAAGSGIAVCEYVFQDVPAGDAVLGVCSTEDVTDSAYTTATVTLGGVAGRMTEVIGSVTEIASSWLTEGGILLYAVGFSVVAFIWRRVAKAVRR